MPFPSSPSGSRIMPSFSDRYRRGRRARGHRISVHSLSPRPARSAGQSAGCRARKSGAAGQRSSPRVLPTPDADQTTQSIVSTHESHHRLLVHHHVPFSFNVRVDKDFLHR